MRSSEQPQSHVTGVPVNERDSETDPQETTPWSQTSGLWNHESTSSYSSATQSGSLCYKRIHMYTCTQAHVYTRMCVHVPPTPTSALWLQGNLELWGWLQFKEKFKKEMDTTSSDYCLPSRIQTAPHPHHKAISVVNQLPVKRWRC